MSNSLVILFLGLGGVFGFLAALMAYLITYGEYIHHYPNAKKPRQLALEAAAFTFIFFFALTLAAGYIITKYIQ